jgi:GNAT superfamily N-acetyltransferase
MEMMKECIVCTYADRPETRPLIEGLELQAWPRFMLHGDVRSWHSLFESFADCQLLLCRPNGELLAVGHTVPLFWDGSFAGLPATIEAIIDRAEQGRSERRPANAVSALAAMVDPAQRGHGLSRKIVEEMKALAARRGCGSLIAPVRPTWKSRYPLMPMDRYVAWRRGDGAPFDPWLRVHQSLGARPLGIAPATVTVTGTLDEWREWTGMDFPASGSYVVPGALQPVSIDREQDLGLYQDPNYWMEHAVGPPVSS